MDLIEQLRKARERWVTVGGTELLIRRPTVTDNAKSTMAAIAIADRQQAAFELMERVIRMSVVGWRNVKESDIIGNAGTGTPVDFNIDLLVEWKKDDLSGLDEIYRACRQLQDEFEARKAETEKN